MAGSASAQKPGCSGRKMTPQPWLVRSFAPFKVRLGVKPRLSGCSRSICSRSSREKSMDSSLSGSIPHFSIKPRSAEASVRIQKSMTMPFEQT